MNFGEAYLDHYEKFMKRNPAQSWTYKADGPTLQILAYDGIFERCRVFVTLGLTHFRERLGDIVEVVTVADDGLEDVPSVLGHACLYVATEGQGFAPGRAMSGVENINGAFAREIQKSALYFSEVQGFPPEFGIVCATPEHGRIANAMFISAAEFAALRDFGPEEFESALTRQHVDPFALRRPSAIFEGPSSRQ